MKLTPHEEKILKIIKQHPKIIDNPEKRNIVAKQNGLTEKTLRNRIAEFRKRGFLDSEFSVFNFASSICFCTKTIFLFSGLSIIFGCCLIIFNIFSS